MKKLKFKIEDFLFKIKNGFEEKYFRWGYDKEGDLALLAFGILFVFYKWSSPTIIFNSKGFIPLNNSNSKETWRKIRKEKT